jgi:hypothetical protein
MSTSTTNTHRAIVSLNLPKKVPALITYTSNIVDGMTDNPSFPAPTPTLAVITTAISALQTAETGTLARTKGAAATRDEKRAALVALMQQLRTYIQTVSDGNPATATSVIQSARLTVRKAATPRARVFTAKHGPVSGTAQLVAPSAGTRASYEWQYSPDGGKTWVTLPPTLQAKTSVSGLQPATVVELKYRAVTKTGATDWSPTVSLVVQ